MSLELTDTIIPTDADLRKAIELRCSGCFGAMNIANAIAGRETLPWRIVRAFTLRAMLDEATSRGLDVSTWKTAVEEEPLTASRFYRKAMKEDCMNRKAALGWLKSAGYHADSKAWTRLYVENRISYTVARAAWNDGIAARLKKIPCTCYTCTQDKA